MLFEAIALYTVLVSVAVFGVVMLSGYFPAEARPTALRQPGSQTMIHVLVLAVLGLVSSAAWIAVTALPWAIAIIATGLSVLFAPLVFQALPRSFCDSRTGVAVIVTGAIVLLLTVHLKID